MYSDVDRMLQALGGLRAVSEIPVIVCGMRKSEFMALAVLHETAESDAGETSGLTVSQLARELDVSPAAVSQLISTLSAKLYVERVADMRDRRVVRIMLTDKGIQAAAQAKEQLRMTSERILETMGPVDAHHFVSLLMKASKAINHEIQGLRKRSDASEEDSTCENT